MQQLLAREISTVEYVNRLRAKTRERRFQRACDRLRIPHDVRERIRRATGDQPPDWYAGRSQS